MSDKKQRRIERIKRERAEESRRSIELEAYRSANNFKSDNPIRISDIPYTRFEG